MTEKLMKLIPQSKMGAQILVGFIVWAYVDEPSFIEALKSGYDLLPGGAGDILIAIAGAMAGRKMLG